jgi:acyl dehydratase
MSMIEPELFFEDFPVGRTFDCGHHLLHRDDIIAFAQAFDPQPLSRSGMVASGWHLCAVMMRRNYEGYLRKADGRGAPGIDEVSWLKPVGPDILLRVRGEVLGARESRSRPSIGLVQIRSVMSADGGDPVMTQSNFIMLGRRGANHPMSFVTPASADAGADQNHAQADLLPAYADLEVGRPILLGTRYFPAEEIISFARLYDPQTFHVDADAAKAGPFGALAASGWHTAASWMRCLADAEARSVSGGEVAEPKPEAALGVTDLRWIKPVYAGDSISFFTTPLEKRASSHPGWGLVARKNGGVNQRGEAVFEFKDRALWR